MDFLFFNAIVNYFLTKSCIYIYIYNFLYTESRKKFFPVPIFGIFYSRLESRLFRSSMKISLRKVLAITQAFQVIRILTITNSRYKSSYRIIRSKRFPMQRKTFHPLNSISSASFDTCREFYPVNAFYSGYYVYRGSPRIFANLESEESGVAARISISLLPLLSTNTTRFVKIYIYKFNSANRKNRWWSVSKILINIVVRISVYRIILHTHIFAKNISCNIALRYHEKLFR